LKELDSGFRRNDKNRQVQTFYEITFISLFLSFVAAKIWPPLQNFQFSPNGHSPNRLSFSSPNDFAFLFSSGKTGLIFPNRDPSNAGKGVFFFMGMW